MNVQEYHDKSQQYSFQGGGMSDEEKATYLQIRLNTQLLLEQLEAYFRGKRIYASSIGPDGKITYRYQEIGEPLANDKGIQQIMHDLNIFINPQSVQGNMSEDQIIEFLMREHSRIAKHYIKNAYNYGIKDEELNNVIGSIMAMADPFVSRTKEDGERRSYGDKGSFMVREEIKKEPIQAPSIMKW